MFVHLLGVVRCKSIRLIDISNSSSLHTNPTLVHIYTLAKTEHTDTKPTNFTAIRHNQRHTPKFENVNNMATGSPSIWRFAPETQYAQWNTQWFNLFTYYSRTEYFSMDDIYVLYRVYGFMHKYTIQGTQFLYWILFYSRCDKNVYTQ